MNRTIRAPGVWISTQSRVETPNADFEDDLHCIYPNLSGMAPP